MARITAQIALKVEKIARKLTSNDDEFFDAFQEGLTKICEMINGHTESYYVQYAYRRIQNYLKKTRKVLNRETQIVSEQFLENVTDEPLGFGIRTTVPNYDDIEY